MNPVAAVRRLGGRTPLRVSLVVALVALLTLGLVLAGAASTAMLSGYLVRQIDDRLLEVSRGFADRPPPVGSTPSPAPPQQSGGGPPSDLYVAYLDAAGSVVGELSNPYGAESSVPALPAWTLAEVQAQGTVPFTVGSDPAGETWRVVARPLADGSGSVMVAQNQSEVGATVRQLVVVQTAVGLIVVLGLGLLAFLVIRRSLAPLAQVEHAAERFADGDLTIRVPDRDPRTEVGSLGHSFNSMASRVERSFAAQQESEASARASEAAARESERRMRQFVADASHELRTPLTSIRGFSELYRQGALPDRAGVDRAMLRIEGESTRMGLLVDDLLTLARLDRGREPRRDPVDLLVLVGDAVHDARATDPDRPVRLEVAPGPRPPVVLGDEPGLRQVLSNLMSNALRHTPPGSPVEVLLAVRDDAPGAAATVVVDVVDHGPGLSPAAAARVFERFYRADEARSRDHGGTGLGLAIVDSVVAAHGGRVELVTAPGQGATFRVLLPLAP